MIGRPYNADVDREAAHRIWYECHWISNKDQERNMDEFLAGGGGRVHVAELNGEAECLVASAPGSVRYLEEELRLSVITGVTTSRVARKQRFAGRLTAEVIAADVVDGAQVCVLSMFEQGFYDRLGFGTGGYEHMIRFDPADLNLDAVFRPPRRLSKDDAQMVHEAMLSRMRGHGGCNLLPVEVTKAELGWNEREFGLGYCDGPDGALSHFFWVIGKDESGPYHIKFLAYQTYGQLMELLALLKSLGDQIRLVSLVEPADIQLQDLVRQPFRGRTVTARTEYEQHLRANAYWQMRICDMPGCLEKTHLPGETVRFNLKLSDPIGQALDSSSPWSGVAGDYIIALGPESKADLGEDAKLPTMTASVGAFTRLWLGVRPASGLSATDELSAPVSLLAQLDHILRVPPARVGWDF
ncbi:MAG: GNAT family N-acetyltransferase [Candidatus Latescibacteria bacterium]|nr:GNAT family N-acetyltransferase [Candidatus Latescibacterota bacterium]